jgi:hypothetical protein
LKKAGKTLWKTSELEQMESDSLNESTIASNKDFSLANDKIRLSSPIKLKSWCPTMDLVALVTVSDCFIWVFVYLIQGRKRNLGSQIFIMAEITHINQWRKHYIN